MAAAPSASYAGLSLHPEELAALYRAHIDHLGAAYGAAVVGAGLDALVIASGPVRARSPFDDQDLPFRPTPAFAHWSPLAEADAALVIAPGARPRLLRTARASYWDGPTPDDAAHAWASFDVAAVAPDALAGALPRGRVAFVGDVAEQAAAWGIADRARVNPPALLRALDAIRTRKTPYERRCIAEANRRAAVGHRRAFEAFHAWNPSELELHLLYLAGSSQDDPEAPYKGIVALGRNAGVLHHVHYGRRAAEPDESLLIDAGARVHGYCSDITRTDVRGTSDAAVRFRALVDRVDGLQREICRRVRPGLAYESLHDQAHELLASVLRELGLIAASDDELVGSGATRVFLPHGLGHSLGVQVHDVGTKLTPPRAENPYLRNTSIIEDGQVFTIEPGCYFIPSLLDGLRSGPLASRVSWPIVDALARFGGVRIEDDVAVVDGKVENLTRQAWDGPGQRLGLDSRP